MHLRVHRHHSTSVLIFFSLQYLADLGYKSTVTLSAESLKEALDWLLNHAINLEYQDNAAQYNADASHYLDTKGTMDVDSGLNCKLHHCDPTAYITPRISARSTSAQSHQRPRGSVTRPCTR